MGNYLKRFAIRGLNKVGLKKKKGGGELVGAIVIIIIAVVAGIAYKTGILGMLADQLAKLKTFTDNLWS